jgi:hypothetical protein
MMNLYSEEIMKWSYKTEHFSLKKEGLLGSAFLDEAEIEISLNEFGKAGWELVSFMEVSDGVIAIFKQPFSNGLSQAIQEEPKDKESSIVPVAPQESFEKQETNTGTDRSDEDIGDIKIF